MKLEDMTDEDIAKGKGISRWQSNFLTRFDDDLLIFRTGVGAGKSEGLAIWLTMQCIQKPGIRGIIIAQSYDALDRVLVTAIRKRCVMLGANITYNKNARTITFGNGSVLMGYSAQNAVSLLGLTEIAILAIDEAAYIPEEVYNFASDRLRGSKYKTMVRLISSPQSMAANNWFTEICKKYPDKVITATSLDNPFTKQSYKEGLKERYCEGSDLYRQQVLGELFDTDVASQIVFRKDFIQNKKDEDNITYMGIDCSGLGADFDCYAVIDKYGVKEIQKRNDIDTFGKANLTCSLIDKYGAKEKCVDATGGYSQGLQDVLKERNISLNPINFSQKAFDPVKYPNARTEMYMELAHEIRNGFWVPDSVRVEILAMQSAINNKGQIFLLPKDDVKKIIGHSPDEADAVALAVYAMRHYGKNSDITDDKKAEEIASKYLSYFRMYN